MYSYKLDYTIHAILDETPSREQLLLKKYTKEKFSKKEAAYLWERITDHKWYVGERLKRDVGFHVATIDFLENVYEEGTFFNTKRRQSRGVRRVFDSVSLGLRNYFISKSKVFQL